RSSSLHLRFSPSALTPDLFLHFSIPPILSSLTLPRSLSLAPFVVNESPILEIGFLSFVQHLLHHAEGPILRDYDHPLKVKSPFCATILSLFLASSPLSTLSNQGTLSL